MMNLYRDSEEKKFKKDVLGGVKNTIKTSAISRAIALIRVTRAIKKVTAEDTAKLQEIQEEINKYDLTDTQFGKSLSEDSLEKFNTMLEENELYSEQCAI